MVIDNQQAPENPRVIFGSSTIDRPKVGFAPAGDTGCADLGLVNG